MGNKKQKSNFTGSYFGVPHSILRSNEWNRLPPRAIKLIMSFGAQYYGNNNGDLSIAIKIMKELGWKSKSQLYKARNELLENGWIIRTRVGGTNKAALYALTFRKIDECKDKAGRSKFDHGINPTRKAPDNWKI